MRDALNSERSEPRHLRRYVIEDRDEDRGAIHEGAIDHIEDEIREALRGR